jgi:hypothetical protein
MLILMSNNYGTPSIKYKTSAHYLITNDLPCSQSQINKMGKNKEKKKKKRLEIEFLQG